MRYGISWIEIIKSSQYADDLSTKPKIQRRARDAYNKFAPLSSAQAREDYVNFYAYLHTVTRWKKPG
jgi:hypothetical protein